MHSPVKIFILASSFLLAACQHPEEPKVAAGLDIATPQVNAAVSLLGVMSKAPINDDQGQENSVGEIRMSPYVMAASKAEKQYDEERQHCDSLAADRQYNCMATANANYEVTKADAETLRDFVYIDDVATRN